MFRLWTWCTLYIAFVCKFSTSSITDDLLRCWLYDLISLLLNILYIWLPYILTLSVYVKVTPELCVVCIDICIIHLCWQQFFFFFFKLVFYTTFFRYTNTYSHDRCLVQDSTSNNSKPTLVLLVSHATYYRQYFGFPACPHFAGQSEYPITISVQPTLKNLYCV